MRLLHFDILAGIAGDMTVGALIHLGAPLQPVREALQAMGLAGVRLEDHRVEVHGLQAVRFTVRCPGAPTDAAHAHRSYAEIRGLLRAGLSGGARDRAEAIFARLAEAEGRVHGVAPDAVGFHEVGAVDSIADVVGCALGLEALGVQRISASPPLTGHGLVESAHGSLPVPAPATVEILRGIRLKSVDLEAELTTPTGAAIVATQAQQITTTPDLVVEAAGYGAGSRTLPDRPNLLRLLLGRSPDEAGGDEEWQLEANLDDLPPSHFEHLMERLFGAGALDVWLQPVIMKKSRPGVVIGILAVTARLPALEEILFRESTTIGLRRQPVSRRKLDRRVETAKTPWGAVRVKIASLAGEVLGVSPEYEDCKSLALQHAIPLRQVMEAARAAFPVPTPGGRR